MLLRDRLNKRNCKDGPITLAFMGDSITQGCFESSTSMHDAIDYECVYHNRLKKRLEFFYPNLVFNVINAGIGGDMAKRGAERFERDVLSKNPDLIVICYGLNDINCELDEYVNPLEKMFLMSKKSDAQTVFMTPNMFNTYLSDTVIEQWREYAEKTAQYQTGGRFDKYIECARSKAEQCAVTVCDCYAKWKALYNCGVDTTMLLANGINHPVRKMHNLFADSLFNVLFE